MVARERSVKKGDNRGRRLVRGGYRKRRPGLDWVFEKTLSLLLLTLALPLFILLALANKLRDGGPIFYRSPRLGREKKLFHMLKFRTQPTPLAALRAKQRGERMGDNPNRLGRFLRDTRLDELPQFINVLKGEMTFFGPRPERPEIYEQHCRELPNYDQRFAVKPGLMGYSQLFTPFGAPKRLRVAIDNTYAQRDQLITFDLGVVLFTLGYLTLGAIERFGHYLWLRLVLVRRFGKLIERRTLARVRPKGVEVQLFEGEDEQAQFVGRTMLGDINERSMLVYTERALEEGPLFARLIIRRRQPFSARRKVKTARCRATIYRVREVDHLAGPTHAYVLNYEPISPFNRYLFDKYFTHLSIL